MADGSNAIIHGRIVHGREAAVMSLAQALEAGHLVCRCHLRCGHVERADVGPWLCSAADRLTSLGTLSRRLRCICGSREVRLEVWPVTPHAEPQPLRMVHWRA